MRHISSRIAVLLAIAVIFTAPTASASGKPINTSIDGKSVLLARRPDPGFLYITSGGSLAAAAAALGPLHDMRPGSEMQDAGRRLATADGIDDPAISLGTVLLTDLVNNYKLQLQDSNAVIVSTDKELEILRKRNQADLIFEFYTEAWRTFYFLDFKHYDIWYYAKTRLIDSKTGSVIRQTKCAHRPVRTAASPMLDELVADHGARLRAAVEAASELCLATVRQEFGIPASK